MTNFPFNTGIPAAGNNPSNDQPDMLTNNQSTNGILAIDHVSFNTTDGGEHLQVTFNSKNTPGAQTDPKSVLYTANGTASSVASLNFVNQNGTYLVNAIKAAGAFTTIASTGPFPVAVGIDSGFNIASISKIASNQYAVTITSGAITGTNVIVLAGSANTYTSNTLTFTNLPTTGTQGKVNFAIIQV